MSSSEFTSTTVGVKVTEETLEESRAVMEGGAIVVVSGEGQQGGTGTGETTVSVALAYIYNEETGEVQEIHLSNHPNAPPDHGLTMEGNGDQRMGESVEIVTVDGAKFQLDANQLHIFEQMEAQEDGNAIVQENLEKINPEPIPAPVTASRPALLRNSRKPKTEPRNPEQEQKPKGKKKTSKSLQDASLNAPPLLHVPGELEEDILIDNVVTSVPFLSNEFVFNLEGDAVTFNKEVPSRPKSSPRKRTVNTSIATPKKKSKTVKKPIVKFKCLEPDCLLVAHNLLQLRQHLTEKHELTFDDETKEFASESAFQEWRLSYERERMVSFVRRGGSKKNFRGEVVTYLICHRTGHYKSRVKSPEGEEASRKRKLKPQGSCKMGGYCTAGIKVVVFPESGQVTAAICHTHYGHPLDSEAIPHLRVNPILRNTLIKKFEEGLSFPEMLAYIHHNPDGMEGLRVLDRRSVRNVYDAWKLKKGPDPPAPPPQPSPEKNEPVKKTAISAALEQKIEKLHHHGESGPSILLYKRSGECLPKYGETTSLQSRARVFREGDFCLIIQTPVQRQIFQMFHKLVNIELMESASPNDQGLKLAYVAVLDDFREAIPVAWMICDGISPRYWNQFFRYLRHHCGDLAVRCLLSSWELLGKGVGKWWNAHYTHKAEYLQSEILVKVHLRKLIRPHFPNDAGRLCAWDALEKLVECPREQDVKSLKDTLEKVARASAKSADKAEGFLRKMQLDWYPRISEWCFAYRLNSPPGVSLLWADDDFMKLKTFVTFQDTKVLSQSVDPILKIGYDKCFLRTKRLFKGDQILNRRREHLETTHRQLRDKPVEEAAGATWKVGEEKWEVRHLGNPCDCKIKCGLCSCCVHEYLCSCPEWRKERQICGHIHLVHCFRQGISLEKEEEKGKPAEVLEMEETSNRNIGDSDEMPALEEINEGPCHLTIFHLDPIFNDD